MSEATTPTTTEAPAALALDEGDLEPRTPMKRLGSTRKLAAFNNIRVQLSEQSRVLEARAEATAGVAGELHEYCRRRAELEHEYARALDKLARAAHARHKDQRHKREQWPLVGAHDLWLAALDHTRALARDHAALADLYAGPLAARLQRAAEDALRLHRKCRDIVAERHEELAAALGEAARAGKAHAAAAHEWRAAAAKLRHAHDARARLAAADTPRHKKLKALDKELDKRRARHAEARTKALRARADYVLALEAANATLQRYYLDDIADIILCMEVGFEAGVGRAMRAMCEAEEGAGSARRAAAAAVRAAALALDALHDRRRVLDAHADAFAPPREPPPREPLPERLDAELAALLPPGEPLDDEPLRDELAARLLQLEAAARALRAECRETAKTLDAAEAELVRQMEGDDAHWDVSRAFGEAGAPPPGPPAPPEDQEDYYLAKFRAYVACAGRLARVESKAAGVRSRLLGGAAGAAPSPPSPPARAAARLRRGQFAAPLGPRLPGVLTSCVRVLARHGVRHQGVFRVSGSQLEVQALRAAFERGEDPLAGARRRGAADVNSVAGLLKLYLRELRPPLLPPALQERLLRAAAERDDAALCARLRATLAPLPLPALLVLRYLFAFLAHLAEHSARNMMDAWNLAICLGPTLLPAGGEAGAQVARQNLVNELVKRIILHHEEIFPQDVAPHALYTRPSEEEEEESEGSEAEDEGEGEGDREEEGETTESVDRHDAPDDLSLYNDGTYCDEDSSDDEPESGDWTDAFPRNDAAQEEPTVPDEQGATGSSGGCRRLAESTPDLVLDLPARAALAADTFAAERDTLRRRAPAAREPPAAVPPAAEPPASPVPARNTARVAAKFAELTLTGGSLKPALAAKPALLRRPTPHPHRSPAPPPAPAPDPDPDPRPAL